MTTGVTIRMQYKDLVKQVSLKARVSPETVKQVLFALPDVLVSLKAGEMVRTPLGVFRSMIRAPRLVTPPALHAKPVRVGSEQVVKLKAGTRLRR